MQTIFLVRHGQTEWNLAGRMQGQRNSPLTPLGEEQARRVGMLMRRLVPDPDGCAMVVSPLGRAMQTAAMIAEAMGIGSGRFAVDPLVQEVGWGAWEGRTDDEIAAADPEAWRRFQADPWATAPPSGESFAQLAERARRWLASAAGSETVVLVSHREFGRVLRGQYLSLPPDEALKLPVPQDAVFRLSQGTISRVEAEPAHG